jgi:hypothetical protein
MPSRNVVLTGTLTWADEQQPQPPGIWGPTDPRPTHPIVVPPGGNWPQPPQPPLGIWGPTDPRPGWGLPTPQPPQFPNIPSQGPGFPTHPIQLPPWAGGWQPRPDQGLPGGQPYPDQGLPGSQPRPDQGLPGSQPRPDNTLPGEQPYPDNALPGLQPPQWPAAPEFTPIPGGPSGNFQWFLSPVYGWVLGVPSKGDAGGGEAPYPDQTLPEPEGGGGEPTPQSY